MKNKTCPYRKHCHDVGTCETCDFGRTIESLKNKIKRIKVKNEALQAENEKLKDRIERLTNPNF